MDPLVRIVGGIIGAAIGFLGGAFAGFHLAAALFLCIWCGDIGEPEPWYIREVMVGFHIGGVIGGSLLMAVGVCFDYGLRGKSWYTILASLGTGVVLGVALPAVVAFWTGSFELYFTTLLLSFILQLLACVGIQLKAGDDAVTTRLGVKLIHASVMGRVRSNQAVAGVRRHHSTVPGMYQEIGTW